MFPATQHMMGNIRLEITGDAATGRSICLNPMTVEKDGQQQQFFLGFWYEDEFVRTAMGWRIRRRCQVASWQFNTPDFLLPSSLTY